MINMLNLIRNLRKITKKSDMITTISRSLRARTLEPDYLDSNASITAHEICDIENTT